MDLIVTACRALANRARLNLIRAIHAKPGSTVNALAKTVRLPPNGTSHHLKLLGNFHFVQCIPSGRYVRYRPAKPSHISNDFLRAMLAYLHNTLGGLNPTPHEVWDSAARKKQDAELVNVFTTYTHLRRLLVLRQLVLKGSRTSVELAALVGMSDSAINRHLAKLHRRGVVRAAGAPPYTWQIETDMPPLRQNLLRIVVDVLQTNRP